MTCKHTPSPLEISLAPLPRAAFRHHKARSSAKSAPPNHLLSTLCALSQKSAQLTENTRHDYFRKSNVFNRLRTAMSLFSWKSFCLWHLRKTYPGVYPPPSCLPRPCRDAIGRGAALRGLRQSAAACYIRGDLSPASTPSCAEQIVSNVCADELSLAWPFEFVVSI
jgi:hypothetical protein